MAKVRPGTSGSKAFLDTVHYHLRYSLGQDKDQASEQDKFHALCHAVRNVMVDRMLATQKRHQDAEVKSIYYISMEFLMGRSLGNNIYNLGIYDLCRETARKLGMDLEDFRQLEFDAALGNGGLGRLAACFLDSMATIGLAGYGYGINYEFGLFKQVLDNGRQLEKPDHWSMEKGPWLLERPAEQCLVPVYGRLHQINGPGDAEHLVWLDWKVIVGMPYDMPIVGYRGDTVNFLRLFSARSSDEFDMEIFNAGDYINAVKQKISSETVSKVLYPADSIPVGKELRLLQEYFLVACSIRDIVRRHLRRYATLDNFSDKVAIQLNDTHPALAVAELMRLLLDEHDYGWDEAFSLTKAVCSYTNHTLLPEALETWPVGLMEHLLPRHMRIIYEINFYFLQEVAARWPGDIDRLRRMSIIDEDGEKQVRMANLAIVGSHSVNGVAALHTELVKKNLVPDFYELWPGRFNNKTNGVTPRRWLLKSNPGLSRLLKQTVGDGWITNMDRMNSLVDLAQDPELQKKFEQIKLNNKELLAKIIFDTTRIRVNPNSLFDVHAKRLHEYKRQLLNIMHVIALYLRIVEDNQPISQPKTSIFAGKAAPSYFMAKLIIKLINNVAQVVNNDPRVEDRLKVAFIPDYRVSLAEKIIPAADLSEQISTAGMEASGTGNMKFAMNGALTIGTMDGANIEIREEVGDENIYIFGLTSEEILSMREHNSYDPGFYYRDNQELRRVVDALAGDRFTQGENGLFGPIVNNLLHNGDYYFHMADFTSYLATQDKIAADFLNRELWNKMVIHNVARMGKFSSDRTIMEYSGEIWSTRPSL